MSTYVNFEVMHQHIFQLYLELFERAHKIEAKGVNLPKCFRKNGDQKCVAPISCGESGVIKVCSWTHWINVLYAHRQVIYHNCVKYHQYLFNCLGGVVLPRRMDRWKYGQAGQFLLPKTKRMFARVYI